jgi:hypothetical protein
MTAVSGGNDVPLATDATCNKSRCSYKYEGVLTGTFWHTKMAQIVCLSGVHMHETRKNVFIYDGNI